MEFEPPDVEDSRSWFWIRSFGILNRTRPASMGGLAPINPVDALDLAERLQWPCEPTECVHVICALDDAWREMQKKSD